MKFIYNKIISSSYSLRVYKIIKVHNDTIMHDQAPTTELVWERDDYTAREKLQRVEGNVAEFQFVIGCKQT